MKRFIERFLSIIVSCTIVFVCLYFLLVSNVQASPLFTLSNGQVACVDPTERPYCVPEQELFSEMNIVVQDNGEVSGEAKKAVSFEHAGAREGTSESYNGSASISIRGTYDYYTRTIRGTFDYKTNLVYIVHRGGGEDSDPLNKTSNKVGQPFTGKAEGDSININFNKTFDVTYGGVPRGSEVGKLDEDMDNWAITSGAEEQERNDKVYTGKIKAELGGNAGLSDMYGQVEVNIPQPDGSYDEEDWSFAKLDGKTFPVGTHIKTSDKSGALINFGQMTIHLGPDSELIIAPAPEQPGSVELLWGNLKANVNKMMKDGSVEIEMSQAVAGIKGTIFILEETKDTSTIKVTEGSVSFTSKSNGQGETVTPGETITASKNGLGEKTTFDVAKEETQWNDLAENFKEQQSNYNLFYLVGFIIVFVVVGYFLRFKIWRKK